VEQLTREEAKGAADEEEEKGEESLTGTVQLLEQAEERIRELHVSTYSSLSPSFFRILLMLFVSMCLFSVWVVFFVERIYVYIYLVFK
jgi:hypothetical protein